MTKKRTPSVLIALNIVLWCGVGYFSLKTAAIHWGEVMHDAYCQDH